MTTLFARLGHLEARNASVSTTTKWSSGTRLKRGDRLCLECRVSIPRMTRSKCPGASRSFAGTTRRRNDKSESMPTRANKKLDVLEDEYNAQSAEPDIDGLWERYKNKFEGVNEPAGEERDVVRKPQSESLLELDYAAVLPMAIEQRDMDLIIRCITSANRANDKSFICDIPQATFSEILQIIEPANSIKDLMSTHEELSSVMTYQIGLLSMNEVAFEYQQMLSDLITMRRNGGVPLTLADYTVLLRSARDLGKYSWAKFLWVALNQDGHVPDTACWNYSMGAEIFNRRHTAAARFTDRVIEYHMKARRVENPGQAYRGYRVGRDGIQETTQSKLSQMVQAGLTADEETFRMVMMAAAREGDISTVKAVLRRIWDIDVNGIMEDKVEQEIAPKTMAKDSSFYPNVELLYTISHAFGINNDLPTALRVVDFVSRRFEITIEQKVWDNLFQWAFALATRQINSKAEANGFYTGLLPREAVLNLWDTMNQPPYSVQPSMGMYDRLVRNLRQRDWTVKMLPRMQEGRRLQQNSSARANNLLTKLDNATLEESADSTTTPGSTSLIALRREFEIAEITRLRDEQWAGRWVRLFLHSMRSQAKFEGSYANSEWALRQAPRVLWDWRQFAPDVVRVETVGGTLHFRMRSEEESELMSQKESERQKHVRSIVSRVPIYFGDSWFSVWPRDRRARLSGLSDDEETKELEMLHHERAGWWGDE